MCCETAAKVTYDVMQTFVLTIDIRSTISSLSSIISNEFWILEIVSSCVQNKVELNFTRAIANARNSSRKRIILFR